MLLLMLAGSQWVFAVSEDLPGGLMDTASVIPGDISPENTLIEDGFVYLEDSLFGDITEPFVEHRFQPDPRKAAMYSAVLPGLGQIYNRKYWKVPIVYGGFTALSWYAMFTHEEFMRYRNAHSFRIDGNPETIDEFIDDFRYTEDVLQRFRDYYRRQRDRSYLWIAIFYAINIIDATVDAHFMEFDVSEELGIRVGPSITVPDRPVTGRAGSPAGPGIRFSVNF